jgi:Ca2+-binding EF-hand superfamily protein
MTGHPPREPKKSDTLQIRIPHETKKQFLDACQDDETSASDVLRRSILDYLSFRKRPSSVPRKGMLVMIPAPVRKKRYLVAGAAVVAGLGLLSALPSAADPHFRASFERLDENHDGQLTMDEYFGSNGASFTIKADALVIREDTQEAVFIDYPPADGAAEDRGIEINTVSDEKPAFNPFFPKLDANDDGLLSFGEYQAFKTREAKARFDSFDRNRDGQLVRDELIVSPWTGLDGAHAVVTVSASGVVTMGPPPAPKPGGKTALQQADANSDGIVTFDEFVRN